MSCATSIAIPDALIMSEVDEAEGVLFEFFGGQQMSAMLNFALNKHLLHGCTPWQSGSHCWTGWPSCRPPANAA